MASPDITLQKGEVLVTQGASSSGIIPLSATILFGYVELVSEMCDSFVAGDYVMFNSQSASKFLYGSTIYYIIQEQVISGKEPPAP